MTLGEFEVEDTPGIGVNPAGVEFMGVGLRVIERVMEVLAVVCDVIWLGTSSVDDVIALLGVVWEWFWLESVVRVVKLGANVITVEKDVAQGPCVTPEVVELATRHYREKTSP